VYLSYAPSSLGKAGGKTAGGTMKLLADVSAVAVVELIAPTPALLAILACVSFLGCPVKLDVCNEVPEVRVFTHHGDVITVVCACRRVWANMVGGCYDENDQLIVCLNKRFLISKMMP
jgi:hypothetical protein